MSPISTFARFCPLGLTLFTAGCCLPANQGNDLLDGACLSGLSSLDAETALPHQSASLYGFDRSGFPRETVVIPMASVETFPTYATPAMRGRDQDASRPFPTAMTALQRSTDSKAELSAALAAPFVAAIDLVISPVRMFGTPPWTIQTEPTGNFELLPPSRVACEAAPALDEAPDASEPRTTTEPAIEEIPEAQPSVKPSAPNEPVPPRADTLQRDPDAARNE